MQCKWPSLSLRLRSVDQLQHELVCGGQTPKRALIVLGDRQDKISELSLGCAGKAGVMQESITVEGLDLGVPLGPSQERVDKSCIGVVEGQGSHGLFVPLDKRAHHGVNWRTTPRQDPDVAAFLSRALDVDGYNTRAFPGAVATVSVHTMANFRMFGAGAAAVDGEDVDAFNGHAWHRTRGVVGHVEGNTERFKMGLNGPRSVHRAGLLLVGRHLPPMGR